MPLTDVARLRAAFSPSLDGTRDGELDRCVKAASDWIAATGGLVLERATYARLFDGCLAGGPGRDRIELDSRHRPVIHSGTDLVTVTEDGITLTVATGFSTTAGVILVGANDFGARCYLQRRNQAWSDVEVQNVSVSYKAGYVVTDLTAIPQRFVQLANEAAWLMFQAQAWLGKSSTAAAGHSVSWEKTLSPHAQDTLAELRRLANA